MQFIELRKLIKATVKQSKVEHLGNRRYRILIKDKRSSTRVIKMVERSKEMTITQISDPEIITNGYQRIFYVERNGTVNNTRRFIIPNK